MYNYKVNYVLDNLTSKVSSLKYFNVNSTELITKYNERAKTYERGIIDSLYIIGDDVFAVVRPEKEITESGDHLPTFFNSTVGYDIEKITIGELGIKTNIRPMSDVVSSYIGKLCRVTLSNGIAIYAEIDYGAQSLTEIPTVTLRNIRAALGDSDLFSQKGKNMLLNYGYAPSQIAELEKLTYNMDYKNKMVTFAGEGVWQKDTALQKDNEIILEPVNIVSGLNNLGMKTKNCHIPTRIFSGK